MDGRQKLTPPRPGSPTQGSQIAHIISAVKRMFVQGEGIRLCPLGDQIQINAVRGPVAQGGGGGTGRQAFYTEASKELLEAHENVVDYAIGRVTAGVNKGVMYIRNVNNDGWSAVNRLE
jgi:hypothetical protein